MSSAISRIYFIVSKWLVPQQLGPGGYQQNIWQPDPTGTELWHQFDIFFERNIGRFHLNDIPKKGCPVWQSVKV